MRPTYKFGWISDEKCSQDDQYYEYPDIYALETTPEPECLLVAPSTQHISVMLELLEVMPEPFWLLYVLVVPRGEAVDGRYQSADTVSRDEAKLFLSRFKEFFECDGRHHIWIRSASSSDLLVYDKHNVIYAYGQLLEFEAVVASRGLTKVDHIQLPFPHAHHYNEIFDEDESALLRYWEWNRTPLEEGDE